MADVCLDSVQLAGLKRATDDVEPSETVGARHSPSVESGTGDDPEISTLNRGDAVEVLESSKIHSSRTTIPTNLNPMQIVEEVCDTEAGLQRLVQNIHAFDLNQSVSDVAGNECSFQWNESISNAPLFGVENVDTEVALCESESSNLAASVPRLIDLNLDPDNTNPDSVGSFCNSIIVAGNSICQDNNVPWKRRNTLFEGPDHRVPNPGRKSALQMALLKFADKRTDYVIDPVVGTEFDDCQEAYEYYNLYSWECGFGIKWGKKRFSENKKSKHLPDEKKYQLGQDFCCSCRGKPASDVKVASIRSNCPALLRLQRTVDHGWIVVHHVDKHNHKLSETCGEKKQWPSHYNLDKYTKDLIRMLRENNIGLTKLYSILGSIFGSMLKVPTTKRCLRTICQKINRDQAEDDIRKTLDVFRELREEDPGFIFVVEPADEGRIKTLMWTSSKSRMQYEHFGDVITFDTTYKTNLYDMPFGLFVGVNNHFQSVLLGGVLMIEETTESFKWVFTQFRSLMGGRAPKTVLTDQCRAMEVALAEVWKDTVHRWCKWHVLRRVRECVGPKYNQLRDFRDRFHKMLNEMLTISEFEFAWSSLIEEFGLEDNAFLKQIYATRKMWVKAYFRDVFCARQTSTQRSESANHMLKTIVEPQCSLHQFVRQYTKLQYIRDEEENYQDRRNMLNSRKLRTSGPLVVEASRLYTINVFNLFCELKEESEFFKAIEVHSGTYYNAEHYQLDRVQRWCKGAYTVQINPSSKVYKCECNLFEHFGLPCAHIIRVLISTGIEKIPESLIMQRWTKRARHILPEHLSEFSNKNVSLKSHSYRHYSLLVNVLEFVQMGDSNTESHKMAMSIIDEGKKALLDVAKEKDGLGLGHEKGQEENPQAEEVYDHFPQRVRKRRNEQGRPSNKRPRPSYEKTSKRPRFCSICHSAGHNCLKCPQKASTASLPRKAMTCGACGLTGHNRTQCSVPQQQIIAMHDALL